jgi:hypothetical protein
VTKQRLVGINHAALEVGDIDEAVGDQFIAPVEGRSQPPDRTRHFGLVVDDKEATRLAPESAGAELLPARGLEFRDPWGNFVQGRAVRRGAVHEPDWPLCGMGLDLGKDRPRARRPAG